MCSLQEPNTRDKTALMLSLARSLALPPRFPSRSPARSLTLTLALPASPILHSHSLALAPSLSNPARSKFYHINLFVSSPCRIFPEVAHNQSWFWASPCCIFHGYPRALVCSPTALFTDSGLPWRPPMHRILSGETQPGGILSR